MFDESNWEKPLINCSELCMAFMSGNVAECHNWTRTWNGDLNMLNMEILWIDLERMSLLLFGCDQTRFFWGPMGMSGKKIKK